MSRASACKIGGKLRDSFPLVKFGPVQTDNPARGGDFVFRLEHARQAAAWFRRLGRRLAIDYEHQSIPEFNQRPDRLVPAAGWINRLEVRDDGLYAAGVEYTDTARSMLERGEYEYFSPVIYWTDGQQSAVKGLGPVALTNDPSICHAEPLVATRLAGAPVSVLAADPADAWDALVRILQLEGTEGEAEIAGRVNEQNVGQVARALGLPEESSVADVRAALRQWIVPPRNAADLETPDTSGFPSARVGGPHATIGQQAQPEAGPMKGGPGMDRIKALLGLPPEATEEEVISKLESLLGESGDSGDGGDGGEMSAAKRVVQEIAGQLELGADVADAETLVAKVRAQVRGSTDEVAVLRQQVATLTDGFDKLRASNLRRGFDMLIASREHEGKVPPARQDAFFKLYCNERELFDSVLDALPPVARSRSQFAGQRGTGPAAGDTTEASLRTAYQQSRELQEEFGDEDAFVAYRQAEAAGSVTIAGRSGE